MQNFYFTFGVGHDLKYRYVLIKADTYMDARKAMFAKYGDSWCSQYMEDSWNSEDNANKDYRLLDTIEVTEDFFTDNLQQALSYFRLSQDMEYRPEFAVAIQAITEKLEREENNEHR